MDIETIIIAVLVVAIVAYVAIGYLRKHGTLAKDAREGVAHFLDAATPPAPADAVTAKHAQLDASIAEHQAAIDAAKAQKDAITAAQDALNKLVA